MTYKSATYMWENKFFLFTVMELEERGMKVLVDARV